LEEATAIDNRDAFAEKFVGYKVVVVFVIVDLWKLHKATVADKVLIMREQTLPAAEACARPYEAGNVACGVS
jgi:hypothetical protein